MHSMTRAELIAHIRATAERMAQTAQLMQLLRRPGRDRPGRQMEGVARIAHGWADGIESESVHAIDEIAGAKQVSTCH